MTRSILIAINKPKTHKSLATAFKERDLATLAKEVLENQEQNSFRVVRSIKHSKIRSTVELFGHPKIFPYWQMFLILM